MIKFMSLFSQILSEMSLSSVSFEQLVTGGRGVRPTQLTERLSPPG